MGRRSRAERPIYDVRVPLPAPNAMSVQARLGQRVRAVFGILTGKVHAADAEASPEATAGLLYELVEAAQLDPSPPCAWLLCTAILGAYPTAEQVLDCLRVLRLDSVMEGYLWLLDEAHRGDFRSAATTELKVLEGVVLVDVDHSARDDLHTGIQQVVRRVLPIWDRTQHVEPVAWRRNGSGWRPLIEPERDRVLDWYRTSRSSAPATEDDLEPHTLIVPWNSVVMVLETPPAVACERLAAVGQYSGNRVVAVGYDCVPVVSGDLVPIAEPVRFTKYLAALKYFKRVAAISSSALAEYGGFTSALQAQGLDGPAVVECVLATEPLQPQPVNPSTDERLPATPEVLCVGSFEPRKNHLALLYASERLWREGLSFELTLIGGSSWGKDVPHWVEHLLRQGRPITVRKSVPTEELAAAYRRARFTVFPSVHEGFGLPIVESLAAGTPVITADYGSAAEIGRGGGTLAVDPRDDDALIDAMRRLLTDVELLRSLSVAALGRPVRTWEDYSRELWTSVVEPELSRP